MNRLSAEEAALIDRLLKACTTEQANEQVIASEILARRQQVKLSANFEKPVGKPIPRY